MLFRLSKRFAEAASFFKRGRFTDVGGFFAAQAAGNPVVFPPTDGPDSVYVPFGADNWTAIGWPAPAHQWDCQAAGGNLMDIIGTTMLVVNGTVDYRQTVVESGWTSTAVEYTSTAGERHHCDAGVGPDPSTNSVTWLAYVCFTGLPAGNGRPILTISNHTTLGCRAEYQLSGALRVNCFGVNVAGSVSHNDSAMHPLRFQYDRTAGDVRVVTDLETIVGTYNAGVIDATKGFGANGQTCAPFQSVLLAVWEGAAAEAVNALPLSDLGW